MGSDQSATTDKKGGNHMKLSWMNAKARGAQILEAAEEGCTVLLGAKGGGSERMIQGNLHTSSEEIRKALSEN